MQCWRVGMDAGVTRESVPTAGNRGRCADHGPATVAGVGVSRAILAGMAGPLRRVLGGAHRDTIPRYSIVDTSIRIR